MLIVPSFYGCVMYLIYLHLGPPHSDILIKITLFSSQQPNIYHSIFLAALTMANETIHLQFSHSFDVFRTISMVFLFRFDSAFILSHETNSKLHKLEVKYCENGKPVSESFECTSFRGKLDDCHSIYSKCAKSYGAKRSCCLGLTANSFEGIKNNTVFYALFLSLSFTRRKKNGTHFPIFLRGIRVEKKIK